MAVVGAGPGGLACAARLLGAGEDVVVLERGEVGAAWTTRYDRLRLHTVRWLSSLPGYRMPRALGKWPARDSVIDYLRRYAARSGITVRTGVEVEQIVREDGRWMLRTSVGDVVADRVVVAAGQSNEPYLPAWPGAFGGEIVHSADYRNAQPYAGRRVLVVGAGNSGAEIAVDVADGGATEVFLAVRTPPHIVRRDTLGFPSQILGIATQHLPVPAVDRIASAMRRLSVPDLAPYGLPAPSRPYSDFLRRRVIPIVDVGLVDAVRRGRVRVVAALERFEAGEAVLADGTTLQIDAVIAATGYRPALEPLVGHLGVLDESGEPLVHGREEHPRAPNLHFVGYRVTLGGTFRLVGIEAKQLASATKPPSRAPR
ncbi:MAG TPA: NAD(P)/FAD-dependent oxidoreductase [Gaiellaceae bacterium]|nr:NAD(P)/FAD-dependent oxidoreductase [Gaiellaceae bacterium]